MLHYKKVIDCFFEQFDNQLACELANCYLLHKALTYDEKALFQDYISILTTFYEENKNEY